MFLEVLPVAEVRVAVVQAVVVQEVAAQAGEARAAAVLAIPAQSVPAEGKCSVAGLVPIRPEPMTHFNRAETASQ